MRTCTVRPAAETRDDWLNRPYVPTSRREAARRADVLLVPMTTPWEEGPVIPEHTYEFFRYLRARLPSDIALDATVDDEGYHEIARHADDVYLPMLVVTVIAFPAVSSLITNYITERWLKRDPENQVGHQIEVTLVRGALEFRFKGPVHLLPPVLEQFGRMTTVEDVTHLLEEDSADG